MPPLTYWKDTGLQFRNRLHTDNVLYMSFASTFYCTTIQLLIGL